MKIFNLINKIVLLIVWGAIICNQFTPLHSSLNYIAIFLLIAHPLEFIIYRKALKNAGENMGLAFIQTMMFGLLYFIPVLKAAKK